MTEDKNDEETGRGSSKDKKKKKTQKAKPKKKGKKKQTETSSVSGDGDQGEQSSYKAGSFQEEYRKFLNERKAAGESHQNAQKSWAASAKRAELLAGLSESELKRRRFKK